MISQSLVDRVLEELDSEELAEEVRLARAAFFEHIPDLCEDDPSHEALTHCFLHWLVIDRPLGGGGGTPLQRYAAERDPSPGLRRELAALAASVHGLFEVLRIEEQGVWLRDLHRLEKLRVTERRQLAGLARGDLLEARLVPLGDKLVFASGAYLLHPHKARAAILAAVGRARLEGSPERFELTQRVQALTFRYRDRYRERVPVEKVYSEAAFSGPVQPTLAPADPRPARESGSTPPAP